MKTATLHIRSMCCQRCIEAVTGELQTLGLNLRNVKLGEANYVPSDKIQLSQIEAVLTRRGFVLVMDTEEILLEKIKTITLDLVHRFTEMNKVNFIFPVYLEEQTKMPYRTLSKIFSRHKKFTIEKYFIFLKIEKIKDLIDNSNLQFSQIAYSMGYKSHQHLSAQFKQVTGITMYDYKKSVKKKRKLMETI